MPATADGRAPGERAPRGARRAVGALAALVATSLATAAHGQLLEPRERPPLPRLAGEGRTAPLGLPPRPLADGPDRARPAAGVRVFVRRFEVRGSTLFTREELDRLTAPYRGRIVGSRELVAAQNAITQAYFERGYVNSGAILPDQTVAGGTVVLDVVEGRLDSVSVSGTRRFRPAILEQRLAGSEAPLDIDTLEERLRLLQMDERIERVDARLVPGAERGRARLQVRVRETVPWQLGARFSNDVAPSLGGRRSQIFASSLNLLGFGDTLTTSLSSAQGLLDGELSYRLPLGAIADRAAPAELVARIRAGRARIVEGALSDDIVSERVRYALGVRRPLLHEPERRLAAGLELEHSRTRLEIFRECFAFVARRQLRDPLAADCDQRVTTVRAHLDWVQLGANRVVAARLGTALGVDWLDATKLRTGQSRRRVPDGEFFSVLLQTQVGQRLPPSLLDAQLRLRLDAQLSNEPLPEIERFVVGGSDSVRGYHENELVRDNGLFVSAELSVPVLRDPLDRERLALIAFADFGRAWNHVRLESLQSIASLGVGARLRLGPKLSLRVDWASRLRSVDDQDGAGLQKAGLHVSLEMRAF